MKKEFIQKVRAFVSGEPLMLTEVLDWLAVSQPIKYSTINPNNSKLSSILRKLQTALFDLELPNELVDRLYPDDFCFEKIVMSYYDVDNVKDWKLAIGASVDDNTKLSYFNYKNAEKYQVKVKYDWPSIQFEIDGVISNDLRFCSNNRIKAKPTSVLKSICDFFYYQNNKKNQEVMDYISYFYNHPDVVTIKEISGEDIRWAYHYMNYVEPSNSSTLWNSCMRHESCQSYFELYCDNPDKIRMVVAVNGHNKVLGRCLLWQPEKYSNVYYDRVYGYSSGIENEIVDYCRKQGYLSIKAENIHIKLKHDQYDYLPYLDNMCFFTSKGIQNFEDVDTICKFQSTTGDHFFNNEDFREVNGRYFHLEDLSYSEYLQSYVEDPEEAYYRPGQIDFFSEDDVWYSELENCRLYMHSDDVVYLEYCGEYAFIDNCVTAIDGELIHESHAVYSEYMDEYIIRDVAKFHHKFGWMTEEKFEELTKQEEYAAEA